MTNLPKAEKAARDRAVQILREHELDAYADELDGNGVTTPDDPARPHIVGGEFQSDKYPTAPRGKVPLSVKDRSAQDLLWEYAQRRRQIDREFSSDLEFALRKEGFSPEKAVPQPYEAREALRVLFANGTGAERVLISRVDDYIQKLESRFVSGPPWLTDAAEALGQKGLALNWNQVLEEIKKLKRLYEEGEDSLAMSCIEPNPKCECAGCRCARARNERTNG